VGAFWIGAVVDRDTLVSVGTEDFYETNEFWPVQGLEEFRFNSIDINSKYYNPNSLQPAYSEQDATCEYYDTVSSPTLTGTDPTDNRQHIPLGVGVTQRSMSWSYDYADDFILFDYEIRNVGDKRLRKVYMGIWSDGDVWHVQNKGSGEPGWEDDIVGFLTGHPAPEGCGWDDTVNIAYHADNDGDPTAGDWTYLSPRSAVGVRVVRTPSDSLDFSFNWWIIDYSDPARDFGPRRAGSSADPFRSFGSRLGTPEGDRNRYYVMRHEEFDYDLFYTAVDHSAEGWLPPPPQAEDFADGYDCRYLLSFGPFDIEPGQALPVSFAWVGGEDFHHDPTAYSRLWDPYRPQEYTDQLDFSDLALNSRWASWVYDNPGVDTDGDGYRGRFRICDDTTGLPPDSADTTGRKIQWIEGDGVPDFRGAGPPPAPKLLIRPSVGKFVYRWNGYYSETTEDVFLQKVDFEGYRVYAGLDERDDSFTLLSSYDRENFNMYRWADDPESEPEWLLEQEPLDLDSLRVLFNDYDFDPLLYTRVNPLHYDGQIFYFEKQDFNVSDLTLTNGIRKAYPEITEPPPEDSSLWQPEDLTDEHGEPLPKYYEYEYVYDGVLSTIPYFLAVTAFDFGSPVVGLPALETAAVNNHIVEYAQNPVEVVESEQLDVYVYPNPYRFDANYRDAGFEGRRFGERDRPDDRVRRIHFANLPRECIISIYSIDGDLIREITHNYPEGGPGSMHNTWDLITRNTQLVVSGLYYWVVESADRTQIGKLVIIQ
jgi:hypothetical protein